jgi:DNA polymerase
MNSMTTLFLDLETYSAVPIKNGTHAYAEGAEIMLFAYAIDDAPTQVWDTTDGAAMPDDLARALRDADLVYAHNSQFDRTVLRHALRPTGLVPGIERWRDTMVQAMAHGLPPGLGVLCDVLKIDADQAKDKDGRALILLFCKPRAFSHKLLRENFPSAKALREAVAQAKTEWVGRATRHTHPEQWAKFVRYASLDIDAMRACAKKMPSWNYSGAELALWHLDQRINDRGVAVDLPLAQAAIRAVDRAQLSLAERTQDLTLGFVESATKRDQLLKHILNAHGVELPDMQMSTLERRIEDPALPEAVRELLAIRLQASTSSTAKYKTLLLGASQDARLRGLLQFAGALRTGRWAGRLWQPQNLPRPVLKQELIDAGIEALMADCADLLFDNVMELTSSAIRGCIVAPPGKKLVVADLSNIEGRVQCWLAGEEWKLDAFRAYDAGTGHDLYKLAYAGSFGIKPEAVTKDQRQVGKVQELALGYEGGVGAFVTFASAYKIDLDAMADAAQAFIPPAIWGQANVMLEWHRGLKRNPPKDFGMADKTWLVCESFVLGWRAAHANIKGMWRELRDNVIAAINLPGQTFVVGPLKIRRDGAWLRIVLPSGRALCYPSPSVPAADAPCEHCNGTGALMVEDTPLDCHVCDGTGIEPGRGTGIRYFGLDQYTRQWTRQATYGGKIFENICQAVARDVMAHNMPGIEAAGYQIVLTVHDEVICEAPDAPEFNPTHLSALLATTPPWALDMPLAAAGFEALRYKKD